MYQIYEIFSEDLDSKLLDPKNYEHNDFDLESGISRRDGFILAITITVLTKILIDFFGGFGGGDGDGNGSDISPTPLPITTERIVEEILEEPLPVSTEERSYDGPRRRYYVVPVRDFITYAIVGCVAGLVVSTVIKVTIHVATRLVS